MQFFNAGNNSQHVRRYKTYVYESCITHLFLKLFVLNLRGGPVWKVEGTEQDGDMATTDTKRSTNVIHFISRTIFELLMVCMQCKTQIPRDKCFYTAYKARDQ